MTGLADSVVRIGPALAVALVLLSMLAIGLNYLGRTGHAVDAAVSILRAAGQLAVLAAVLALVIASLWASAAFVLLMSGVAAWTSAGRMLPERNWASAGWRVHATNAARCLLPVAAPTAVVVIALVLSGVLPPTGLAVIPTAGIMLGGAMNTTSLAGRYAYQALRDRHGEVEAALSLGLSDSEAREMIVRPAAASALIPGLDQTKSVGLVTIPGAFVGMVLGGASVAAAAVMQLFVLIALLGVSSVALVVTAAMVSRHAR
ncbi:MAG: ABC transporter permease [Gordonia sp. (in: high G+C Gram-positive bacteria)]|uniref:ABC transporter permease n=1 Tax=Gordonia sp. (in: high G+C Gram-positive bacteria) TaxID=84139 RepID=UPI003BB63FF9